MPFTVSHVVAVLPLVRGRTAEWLAPAALVIGTMVPDLPYFVPPYRGAELTHSALGPVTVDLVAGLVIFLGWELLLRRPLADLAPTRIRVRLPDPPRLDGRRWGPPYWASWSVRSRTSSGTPSPILAGGALNMWARSPKLWGPSWCTSGFSTGEACLGSWC